MLKISGLLFHVGELKLDLYELFITNCVLLWCEESDLMLTTHLHGLGNHSLSINSQIKSNTCVTRICVDQSYHDTRQHVKVIVKAVMEDINFVTAG